MELDASVDDFLVDTLDFVAEAREAVERFLESHEVIQHRPGAFIPAFTRNYHADTWWIDEREGCRNTTLDLCHGDVVDFVGHELLVGVLRRHGELGKTFRAEAVALQLLDVGLAVEGVHFVADLAERITRITRRVLPVD